MPNLSAETDVARGAAADELIELSAIAGGLAHEVRNSLSTLRMNLQLLDEDWRGLEASGIDDPADARDVARRSRTRMEALLGEAKRLESVLEDFLQFIRRRELKAATHDLSDLVVELADFYRPRADAHKIELQVCRCGEPLICRIDASLMKQALLNLLINAQQAMTRGGTLTLKTSAEDDKTARIDIIDTGPGIPPEILDRVFEAYYSTKKRGTGLGLPVARRIVREHGGRIHAENEPSGGARFTILLPRCEA